MANEAIRRFPENYYEIEKLSYQLLDIIAANCNTTGVEFDKVVSLGLAGSHIANIVGRGLGFKKTDIHNAVVEHVKDPATQQTVDVEFGQMPNASVVMGANALVLDIVSRTGRTLGAVTDYLNGCRVSKSSSGVLYYTGLQPPEAMHVPDWYVIKEPDIVVPPWQSARPPSSIR